MGTRLDQAEELEKTQVTNGQSEEQPRTHQRLQASRAMPQHTGGDASAAGRGNSHASQRMAPPQNPLSRPTGHPPRPFVGCSMRGSPPNTQASGEGGMGALLGGASQLRPPRVSHNDCWVTDPEDSCSRSWQMNSHTCGYSPVDMLLETSRPCLPQSVNEFQMIRVCACGVLQRGVLCAEPQFFVLSKKQLAH